MRGRPSGRLTLARARALAYLCECIEAGHPVSISEAIVRGGGANHWSAKRALIWAAKHYRNN